MLAGSFWGKVDVGRDEEFHEKDTNVALSDLQNETKQNTSIRIQIGNYLNVCTLTDL